MQSCVTGVTPDNIWENVIVSCQCPGLIRAVLSPILSAILYMRGVFRDTLPPGIAAKSQRRYSSTVIPSLFVSVIVIFFHL